MRNLAEFPVTTKEASDIIDRLKTSIMDELLIGDIRPFALTVVTEFLKRNDQEFQNFAERYLDL